MKAYILMGGVEEKEYARIVEDIKTQGFSVVRNFFDEKTLEEYRKECEWGFNNAAWLEGKVYEKDKTPDYTQPWVIDTKKHIVASYRLYQFYHNKHSSNTEEIIKRVVVLRDALEKNWPEIAVYNEKNGFVDYNIVAKYAKESGSQPRHSDAESDELSSPALQCEIYLSRPGIDYRGGDLLLHPKGGGVISTNNDLQFKMGDILFFDKRIEHEVTQTLPVEGGLGRYMALIAAKTFPRKKRSYWGDRKLKVTRFIFLNYPKTYNFLKKIKK